MARENGLQIEGRRGDYKVFDIFDNHLGNWESYSALNDGLYYVNDSFIVDINNLYRWTAVDQSLPLKEDYVFTFVNDSGDIILELEGYDEVNRFEGGYASVKKRRALRLY